MEGNYNARFCGQVVGRGIEVRPFLRDELAQSRNGLIIEMCFLPVLNPQTAIQDFRRQFQHGLE